MLPLNVLRSSPPHQPNRRRCGPEPLLSLAGYRRGRGRINFGQLMNVQQPGQLSSVPQQQQQQQQQQQSQPPDQHDCMAAGQQGGRACKHGGMEADSAIWAAWVAVGDSVFTAALGQA